MLGAIVGAAVLYLILSGKARAGPAASARTAGGPAISANITCVSAFVFEVVGDVPVPCLHSRRHPRRSRRPRIRRPRHRLTLVAIHIVGINVTGVSVNPARSIGPALIGIASNPEAVAQLWLFILAPLIGAGVAGLLFANGVLVPERTELRRCDKAATGRPGTRTT